MSNYFVEIIDIFPSTLEANARIQHEKVDPAKVHLHLDAKVMPLIKLTDIYSECLCRAIFELRLCVGESLSVPVNESKVHPMLVA